MEYFIGFIIKWSYRIFRWSGAGVLQYRFLLGGGIERSDCVDSHVDELVAIRLVNSEIQKLFDYKSPRSVSEIESFLGEVYLKNDIKYYRELGRLTWLDYRIETEELRKIVLYLLNLMRKESVYWECAMDVGIRGVNVVMIHRYLRSSLSEKESSEILNLVRTCFKYTLKHVEYSYIKTNHLATNLSCLLVMSHYLGYQRVMQFSEVALSRCIYQMLENDRFFERSSGYTNIMLENTILYGIFSSNKHNFFPSVFPVAIRPKDYDHLKILNNNSGHLRVQDLLFNYGDNDSGRVFCSSACDDQRDDLIYAFRKLGAQLRDPYNVILSGDFQVVLICDNTGQKSKGGHGHNDKGTILVSYKGCPFLVDNGCAVYSGSSELRNLYRSTKTHNTLYFGVEQADINQGMFVLPEKAQTIRFSKFLDNMLAVYSLDDFLHERQVVLLEPNKFLISDIFISARKPQFVLNLHPDIEYLFDKYDLVLRNKEKGMSVYMQFSSLASLEEEISFYSSGYGRFKESTRLIFTFSGDSHMITTTLYGS